jgi:hypothetical protein
MSGNDNSTGIYSGDIDPEIANLMGIEATSSDSAPEFSDLFGDRKQKTASPDKVDLTKNAFIPISKFEESPKPFFQDKDFYKKALSGGGEEAQKVHKLLGQLLKADDPKDRSLYRGKLISAYWNFLLVVAAKAHTGLSTPKQLLLRYGALLPNIITPDQRSMISRIIWKNTTGESIFYVDEWLQKVASGEINTSVTDETKGSRRSSGQKISTKMESTRGQRDMYIGALKNKLGEMSAIEYGLKEKADVLSKHSIRHDLDGLKDAYDGPQRKALSEIFHMAKQLTSLDKDVSRLYNDLEQSDDELQILQKRTEDTGEEVTVDSRGMEGEFNTVRQMSKMCVGRQGNHFPVLMKQYFRSNIRDIGTRENVLTVMGDVERIDPGLFRRTFKQQTNRIVPYVVLTPCYGDRGICWEPFEKFNRSTSRGRIAVPMFPKDVRVAVITALGDLRWQVAKEKAQHYWMEEGLTGYYYQWFQERKLRGDVKEYFIQDYILWILKESEGTQKLDKEVRGIFWRHVPFSQDLKDKLRKRGYVYNELYKKDINRALSDGY